MGWNSRALRLRHSLTRLVDWSVATWWPRHSKNIWTIFNSILHIISVLNRPHPWKWLILCNRSKLFRLNVNTGRISSLWRRNRPRQRVLSWVINTLKLLYNLRLFYLLNTWIFLQNRSVFHVLNNNRRIFISQVGIRLDLFYFVQRLSLPRSLEIWFYLRYRLRRFYCLRKLTTHFSCRNYRTIILLWLLIRLFPFRSLWFLQWLLTHNSSQCLESIPDIPKFIFLDLNSSFGWNLLTLPFWLQIRLIF